MAWFGQGKDTIEWEEFRDDVLFYKWNSKEIKKGSKLIIREGQKAIFYANGKIEGIFEEPGSYDIASQIIPFLSDLKGALTLRSDSGMRAEVYFVNSKELMIKWGTRQRIMIPTAEVPSGIPVGCNGNLIIEFRDYQKFISKIAGIKSTYSLDDISERIMGEIGPIVTEAILDGADSVGMNVLFALQRNNRALAKRICEETDKELFDIGMGAADVSINSINYPENVQQMAEKVAAQSFVGDVGKYAAVNMADNMQNGGSPAAAMAAQFAMGQQLAQQIGQSMNTNQQQIMNNTQAEYVCSECGKEYRQAIKFCPECGKPVVQKSASGNDQFCPTCRKMVSGKFCPECGTKTV